MIQRSTASSVQSSINQLLYAGGAFGFNMLHQTLTLWLVYRYAPPEEAGRVVLVPIAVFGTLLAIGRVFDSVDDPIIGHLSDVSHTRWGRRLPFIVAGAPFLTLAFILLWVPPVTEMPWTAVYAFLLVQLYFALATVVHQPYESVLAEMTRDSTLRVRISSWKVAFGLVGAGVALVASGILIEHFGFAIMGLLLGGAAAVSILLSTLGIRHFPWAPAHELQISLIEGLRLTATNGQFLIFVVSEVTFFLGLNMLTALVPYFVTVILGQPEGLVSLFTGLFALVAVLSLPAVNWITARRSKVFTYQLAMAVVAVMMPGLYFVGSLPGIDPTLQSAVYIAALGAPMSVLLAIPNPMVADIIDYDEIRTGLRREGVYFGVEETVTKVGYALSTVIFGAVLATFGYSASQSLGIRLVGPVAGLAVLIGLVIFRLGYRLADRVEGSLPAQSERHSSIIP